MLTIIIPSIEQYDATKNEFFNSKEQRLQLEHSLISLSKWESKWHKPFLSREEKTIEETIDYVRCMTITQGVLIDTYKNITNDNMLDIRKYIDDEMTATTIKQNNSQPINREVITSEIIYYWMIELNIPFECEKWHLNRLLTLINVCNIKKSPPKKMGKRELMSRNTALNAARKKALNTGG